MMMLVAAMISKVCMQHGTADIELVPQLGCAIGACTSWHGVFRNVGIQETDRPRDELLVLDLYQQLDVSQPTFESVVSATRAPASLHVIGVSARLPASTFIVSPKIKLLETTLT